MPAPVGTTYGKQELRPSSKKPDDVVETRAVLPVSVVPLTPGFP
jgi:hypothetical protein